MVVNVFGRRGSGKTTLISGNIHFYRSPVMVIDVLGNFKDEGYVHVSTIPDAIDAMRRAVSEFKEKLATMKGTPVIVLKTGDPTLACEYLSAAIWKLETGATLVLDEVDSIQIREGSCFDEYIRYGRNRKGDLITGCRRPAELAKNITAAANKFYCFQTHEPRDIEYFRDSVFGDRAYELMKMEPYSGMFIDFDKKIVGKFRIDILGNVYHTETGPIS